MAIDAAITLGTSIYNLAKSLFKDNRHKMTSNDWNTLIPFSGTMYNGIKSYLSARIVYAEDLKMNFIPFILNYLYDNGYDKSSTTMDIAINNLYLERQKSGVYGAPIPENTFDAFTLRNVNKTPNTQYEQNFLANFSKYFYGTIAEKPNPYLGIDTTEINNKTYGTGSLSTTKEIVLNKNTTGQLEIDSQTSNKNVWLYVVAAFGFIYLINKG